MTTKLTTVSSSSIEDTPQTSLKLSVILTVRNEESSLAEQLERICEQKHKPWEVLVIDDGSVDNSVEIIKNAIERWNFIRLLQNPVNRGIEYSINRGIDESTGEIIHAASCNDPISIDLYETGIELLNQYPQAGLFFCDSIVDNKITGDRSATKMYLLDEPGFLSPQDLARELRGGVIQTNTVLARKDKLIELEVYPAILQWNCDLWTFSYLAFTHGACYAPYVMAEHVVESTSYCANSYLDDQQSSNLFLFMKRALPETDLLPLMKEARFFDYFMYTADPVSLPLIARFLNSENFSKESIEMCLYILIRKFLHRQSLIYKLYFHSFHFYLRYKLRLKTLFSKPLKKLDTWL